jgi:hypothetical protein
MATLPVALSEPAMRASPVILAIGLISLSPAAHACFFREDVAQLAGLDLAMVKKGHRRAYFVKDNCPDVTSRACRDSVFLIAGDVVLVESVGDVTSCVAFVTEAGASTTGFMLNSDLGAPTRAASTKPDAFVGRWISDNAEMRVRKGATAGELSFSGAASHGGSLADADSDARITTGAFDFLATPAGPNIAVNATPPADAPTDKPQRARPIETAVPYDCTMRMAVRGPYLAVIDNGTCGGANVSFTGVFRRL